MKEKDNKNFIIDHSDYVFRIICGDQTRPTNTLVFGDSDNWLEVNTFNDSHEISSIDCMYTNNIVNEEYLLYDYTKIPDIKNYYSVCSYYEEDTAEDFTINLHKDELDIMLNRFLDPSYYYVDGRIQYYYDDDLLLLYIKVVDLTEEEYNYFYNLYLSESISK